MRTVKPWIGRTDNTNPPDSCKLRILDRQNSKCALTGHEFQAGDKIEFDHKTPLWLGGENRESNLQAVLDTAHKRKTQAEATVRSKVNSNRLKHLNIKSKSSRPMPGTRASGLRKRMSGEVERW